ncbi:hypothetical protein DPV78_006336 [Talaromyces pinophilus]|nr:hypothetical protein DPV78_006336 [Talaromyces pinophilus]
MYGYANSGFAIHIWNMTIPVLGAYRKTLLAFAVLYVVALGLAKLAIIMLYYRLLKTFRMWKYILWILAGCICITSTALVLAVILACHPIQEGWNNDLSRTNACSRRTSIHLGTAIANVTSDVMLILVPIVSLWSLHIPLLQKIGSSTSSSSAALFPTYANSSATMLPA